MPLSAKTDEDKEIITVKKGEVINRDFFAWGDSVEISGTINGDLYAFGSQIFIDGEVNGDVIATAGTINISGVIREDARLIAGQIMVSGKIGRSLTLMCGNLEILSPAEISRNLIALSGNMDISGKINGESRLHTSNLRFSGQSGMNLYAHTGSMRITSTSQIDGKLEYWSDQKGVIDPEAEITQGVMHHPSFIYSLKKHPILKWIKIGSKLAALLMNFFYSLILGIVFMRYFPQKLNRSLLALSEKPWQSLLTGLMLLIFLPLISLLLLMTILGVPFAIGLITINVIGFYTAKVFSIVWVSKKMFGRLKYEKYQKYYYIISLMLYFLITQIAYLGGFLTLLSMLFGLGAIVIAKAYPRMEEETKKPIY